MANDSSDFIAFLADDDAAVHDMMSGGTNCTPESPAAGDAAAEADRDSCGVYNWPVLFLFTIVIAAIGTTLFTFVNICNQQHL